MHDERRKGEHSKREKRSRLTGGCFGPVSRSFPLNSSAGDDGGDRERDKDREKETERMKNGGECGRIESQDDMRGGGERDPRDANGRGGGMEESCEALRRMARMRGYETGREEERNGGGEGECGESERRQQLHQ